MLIPTLAYYTIGTSVLHNIKLHNRSLNKGNILVSSIISIFRSLIWEGSRCKISGIKFRAS